MNHDPWDDDTADHEAEKVYAERPNKTAIKRQMLALRAMGRELIALKPQQLDELPLDEPLRDAIALARRLKKGALKRQLIYIEKLMRPLDEGEVQAIRRALDQLYQPHRDAVERLHRIENWRDRLLQGDDSTYADILEQCPAVDRQHLRQLVRNTQREASQGKPPRSARALFKYLDEMLEE